MKYTRTSMGVHSIASGVLILLLLFGWVTPASASSIIYVKYNAAGANNGTSWPNAYKSLQKAISVAASGQQIWVAKGTYKPTLAMNAMDARTKTFLLPAGVAIYGGFAGTETLLSQRNLSVNVSTLSGDIGLSGEPGDNAYHVVVTAEVGSSTILDGFTITGGAADTGLDTYGGGMLNQSSTPTLRNLKISSNYAAGCGGGMSNNGASPTLTNVSFSNNTSAWGGGMCNDSDSPVLNHVTFSGNLATHINSSYGTGGGMYSSNSTARLSYVTFTNNQAGEGVDVGFGGGMYSLNSDLTLTHVTFSGNNANSNGGGISEDNSSPVLKSVTFTGNVANFGGGMYNGSGTSSPALTNVTFKTNHARFGGGMYNSSSTTNPTLSHVAFNANTASGEGGGLVNFSSSPSLTNVTFTGNTVAGYGGGLYNTLGAAPTLSRVSFSANAATESLTTHGDGGGMYNNQSAPTLSNVVFSGNSASDEGGGMFNEAAGSFEMYGGTFSGNTATTAGGGVVNSNGSYPSFRNVTFASNSAPSGGGMYNTGTSGPSLFNNTFSGNTGSAIVDISNSDPSLINTILWGDSPSEMANTTSLVAIVDGIVQGGCPGGASCNHLLSTNPHLLPLQANGGFGKTMALGAGSSAIDTGGQVSGCELTDERGVARPQGGECDMGAYEVRALTFTSQAAYDGWVLESGKNTDTGLSLNAGGSTLRVGDDGSNRRYRGVLSFNTSALPDAASIVRANLLIMQQGTTVADPFFTQGNLVADLAKPYFGASLALSASDWQAAATVSSAASFGGTLIPNGSWYAGALTSAARPDVNKLGTTQFRLRFTADAYNGTAEYISLYSGNASTAADRPQLVVYYNP